MGVRDGFWLFEADDGALFTAACAGTSCVRGNCSQVRADWFGVTHARGCVCGGQGRAQPARDNPLCARCAESLYEVGAAASARRFDLLALWGRGP